MYPTDFQNKFFYLETISDGLPADELLAAVPAKVWHHHLINAVLPLS
jgi:hypothetical protein